MELTACIRLPARTRDARGRKRSRRSAGVPEGELKASFHPHSTPPSAHLNKNTHLPHSLYRAHSSPAQTAVH